ncbi:endonuclease MutS2 [Campylobacter sp. MIT 99-7217]|uniref:endonuclease MutS2 n=1 Tax=Campylobacter sp. MIT 99-7217 TaxID=535091 RepID=UPI0039181560
MASLNKDLFAKLDLSSYLWDFEALLARKKSFVLEGDSRLHFKRIEELLKLDFKPPKEVANLNTALMHISKQGIIHLDTCFEFVKIYLYFSYLKSLKAERELKTWLDKIILEKSLLELCAYFNEKGELKDSLDERLLHLNESMKLKKEQISSEFKRLIYTKNISSYLLDNQIHFINGFDTLLVRGGFASFLKASIVARSANGGFYVRPLSIERLENDMQGLREQKEQIYYEYAKKFSALFYKFHSHLSFINRAFDLFDHYQARVLLAKNKDYDFVLADESKDLILKDFAHPMLKNAKSVDVNFSKQVLIITGVNAGGKTMLLKSLLSAALLAKYLLPMKINANKSKIGSFKDFEAIIEDPQNAKNDISTFAGRMLAFSKLFEKKELLLGIDEIELGTDFEEAASLYSVLVERLIFQKAKIIITTHHKRLAFLLAKNEEVELLAALFDEKLMRPRFEFLQGTIGKSYAFETALRYGIALNLIEKARKNYGEDKQNLEELVGKNINLELSLKQALIELENKQERANELLNSLKEQKELEKERFDKELSRLELDFYKAIEEAKKSIRALNLKDKQRALNKANELKKELSLPQKNEAKDFKIGDFVKYNQIKGQIISLFKNEALIESEGLRLRVGLSLLSPSSSIRAKNTSKIELVRLKNASMSLDLHGLRSEEAIQRLDKFISDALIAGFDEVLIYHGIGTGKLAYAVKEFLKAHKSIKGFSDAPLNQGGFGAKLVRL